VFRLCLSLAQYFARFCRGVGYLVFVDFVAGVSFPLSLDSLGFVLCCLGLFVVLVLGMFSRCFASVASLSFR